MLLIEAIPILNKIKEQYSQYGVDYFEIKEYYALADDTCDILEKEYSIDTTRRVIYLR